MDQEWESQTGAETQEVPADVAMFVLGDNPGLLVNVDDDDNQANHVVLHSDSGTKVSFVVFNVGTAAGTCEVGIEVDNTYVTSWASSFIAAGGSESTEVNGLGRYPAGWHEFLAYVNPGAGYADHRTNTVDILDP